MNIRKAKTADLSALVAFDTVTQGLERRIDDLKTAIVQGRCWIYADNGQGPAGYAILQNDFLGQPFVRLVYVDTEQRRKGIASKLMHHLETAGASDRIFTYANQNNEAMRGLLGRLGYQQCGEIQGLSDREPELVFMKRVGG